MVYKGKNFDPNYHLKKHFDRNHNNNIYHSTYNYNENSNYNPPPPPPPPSRRSVGSPSGPTSPIDNDRSRSTRSFSRPRLEDSIDRRPERSSSRNYDDGPLSRRYDNPPPPPRYYDDKRDSDRYSPSSSSSSTPSYKRDRGKREDKDGPGRDDAGSAYKKNNNNNNIKNLETSLEKKIKVEDQLERNPHDKQTHVDAPRINGDNICKTPENCERPRTPALTPMGSPIDNTNKDEAGPQQQSTPLSTQPTIPYLEHRQDRNTTESDHIENHHDDPNLQIRQSSVGTTASSTIATDNQNPWTRSPSLLSSSSRPQSPASSTTDIHPGTTSDSTLTQPVNWTGQGESGAGATMKRLPSERTQPHQQPETIQPDQSLPSTQSGNIVTTAPSLALMAVDEKINYLDYLWKSGSDKLSQSAKVAEQSVLTCVLRQVLEEVRIYAILRETLQSQDLNGHISTIEAVNETMRQLDSRRKFDITCLQPGVPIPEVPLDHTLQETYTISPLATGNGAKTMTMSAIQQPPMVNIEESEAEVLSSDQTNSADASNPRKRTLEQMGLSETQVSRVSKYQDDNITTGDTEAHQSTLDTTTTTTTPAIVLTLPALGRPHTSGTAEPQVASMHSSSSSSNLLSSSSVSSTLITKTSKWDKTVPNSSSGTHQLDGIRTDLMAQQSNSISLMEANPTSTVANTEQVTSTRGGTGISGRAMMDIEKELRLIREEGQEQRLRTDQLLAQLESEARLRREADRRVSQLTQELQNERYLTLEKDLESKRSEALLMMAKAREEIQQGKALIAQAKEELALERAAKAEAMIETARIEVERNRLLAYVQSLSAPPTASAGGVVVGGGNKPVLPSGAVAVSALLPSAVGSDGGGVLVADSDSVEPLSSLTYAENLTGQTSGDRSIESFSSTEAVATLVKVESSS